MRRTLVIGLALVIFCCFALASGDVPAKPRVTPLDVTGIVTNPDLGRVVDCALAHYNPLSGWYTYVGWYWSGEIMKNFFDPADCDGYTPPTPYPFQIDSVWIPIYFTPALPAGLYTFGVDIECADMTGQNSYNCDTYPGLQVCYTEFTVYYNGLGNYLYENAIPINCCMDQPFFLSFHFVGAPNIMLNPGLVFDTSDVEECIQWYNYPAPWYEWHSTVLYNLGLGNWVKVLYGKANATCEPEECPSACEHQTEGDLCDSPIELPGVLCYNARFDLCDYCNDYNLEPCTGEPSNSEDMVFSFTWNCDYPSGNYLHVLANPVGSWDISVALLTECGNFGGTSCLAGEDVNGPGWPEAITKTGLSDGTYYVIVSGWNSNCGVFDICIESDCPLPVELVSFSGVAGDRSAKLMWRTASETNNDHFYLLRSTNNQNFERASGNIASNSPQGSSYSYMDNFLANGTTYNYKLVDVDINGTESVNSITVTVTPTAGSIIVPDEYALHQNYPNPFNPTTTISYDVKIDGFVTLKVFDILGREVAALVNMDQSAASYTVEFDASNLASGIYFYQLRVNDFTDLKKMVILK